MNQLIKKKCSCCRVKVGIYSHPYYDSERLCPSCFNKLTEFYGITHKRINTNPNPNRVEPKKNFSDNDQVNYIAWLPISFQERMRLLEIHDIKLIDVG